MGFRSTEPAGPSKLASDLRGGGRAGSSPLIEEVEARFAPVELKARGVDCDLGNVLRAGCSDVSPTDEETVGVCVAEVDRLSGGVLTFLSLGTGTGCERYSFLYAGYLGGGSDLIDGLGATGGGLDDASAVSDFEAAAAAESICGEDKPGEAA